MWSIIPTAHWITKSHPKKIVGELSSLGLHLAFLRSEISCDFLSFHWSLCYKKTPKDTFVGQAYGCTKSLNLKRQKRPELWIMLSPYIRTFACCLHCYHAGAPFQGYHAAQNHLSCRNPSATLDSVAFPEPFGRSGDENPFLERCQGYSLPAGRGRVVHFQFRIKPVI